MIPELVVEYRGRRVTVRLDDDNLDETVCKALGIVAPGALQYRQNNKVVLSAELDPQEDPHDHPVQLLPVGSFVVKDEPQAPLDIEPAAAQDGIVDLVSSSEEDEDEDEDEEAAAPPPPAGQEAGPSAVGLGKGLFLPAPLGAAVGHGRGKGTCLRRKRRKNRDTLQGITNNEIRRLARRGGVKRISGLVYNETRDCLKKFLVSVIGDAIKYTEHAGRKTVTALDVVHALKRQGRTLYGFGG